MESLALANKVRLEIANLRRQIKAGAVGLDEALLTADYRSLTVGKLIASANRVTEIKAEKFLEPHRIRLDRPMSEITERQRQILAAAARERYPWAVSQ
jgi:predicted DNA binding protein